MQLCQEVEARGRIGEAYSRKLQAAGVKTANGVRKYQRLRPIHGAGGAAGCSAGCLKEQGIPTAVHYPTLLCQQLALVVSIGSAALAAIHLSLRRPVSV